ncbi:BON domain-containing protein (plasmid) [Caballeronia sp. NK8]|nr:BON domain-containing protein [Caballeronia sp. NK8]
MWLELRAVSLFRTIDMNTLTMSPTNVAAPCPNVAAEQRAAEGSSQIDNALFVAIGEALRQDARLAREPVFADVHDGRVTLRGEVRRYANKLALCEVVGALPGVASVKDCLVVTLPHDAQRTDAALAINLRAALKWEAGLPDEAIEVGVLHGCATLSGEVPWSFQRKLAEQVVARLTGVTEVVNLLRVSDRQMRMQVISRIHAALRRAADIEADDIEVLVADGAVALRGTVSSPVAKKVTYDAVSSLDGVRTVRDETRIRHD